MGRDSSLRPTLIIRSSFNPRARVGRDGEQARVDDDLLVSIHAPAWGATPISARRLCARYGFNPRARVGRDVARREIHAFRHVSIHAPAWGATTADALGHSAARCFNPRARVGRDRRATVSQ